MPAPRSDPRARVCAYARVSLTPSRTLFGVQTTHTDTPHGLPPSLPTYGSLPCSMCHPISAGLRYLHLCRLAHLLLRFQFPANSLTTPVLHFTLCCVADSVVGMGIVCHALLLYNWPMSVRHSSSAVYQPYRRGCHPSRSSNSGDSMLR